MQQGRKVGLCGQAPSNYPEFAKVLVEAGIDSISCTPDSFFAVKTNVAEAEGCRVARGSLAVVSRRGTARGDARRLT